MPLRMIFLQRDADAVRQQTEDVLASLQQRRPEAAMGFARALEGVLAVTAFRRERGGQIWWNKRQERLDKGSRHRTDMIGTLGIRAAVVRLVDALLAKQQDDRALGRRCFSSESVAQLNPELRPFPEGPAPLLPAAYKPPCATTGDLNRVHHLTGRGF